MNQVLLGGDGGATLRDLVAAAALLKSKRVPAHLDLLLAIPSRQTLEVLAATGALTDLIATGARLVEPDGRVMSGELYPAPGPTSGAVGMRTCDAEPRTAAKPQALVASAETLACAVASGEIGDPRSFKRPVRVTVPRTLPTDDVLVIRERRSSESVAKKAAAVARPVAPPLALPSGWKGALTLDVIDEVAAIAGGPDPRVNLAVVCATLDAVRLVAARAAELSPAVRAVFAPFIPSGIVALLSGVGIAAIEVEAAAIVELKSAAKVALPAPAQWADSAPTAIAVGATHVQATWLAAGAERSWAIAGTARAISKPPRA